MDTVTEFPTIILEHTCIHIHVCVRMYVCIGDEIRALQKTLVEYTYQLIQLHQQLTTADRQRTNMQAKILSSERMQQQVLHVLYYVNNNIL